MFKGDENITNTDDLGPSGKAIFTQEEQNYNETHSVNIKLLDVYILEDDSIIDIKNKLIIYGDLLLTTEELYMFYFNKSILNLYAEYVIIMMILININKLL